MIVLDHPLIQHKIGLLRDENTKESLFRELVGDIAMFMAYEIARDYELIETTIKTPMEETKVKRLNDENIALIPILRAGIGMAPGFLKVFPNAAVGHIGLFREHDTLKPMTYYSKLPSNLQSKVSIIVDPMLATGGSAIAAIRILKENGAKKIKIICLIASPEGVKAIEEASPDVEIFTAALDRQLNEKGYILPGLGDAGDRQFGTI